MHMFCFQCQETGENRGCRYFGACGKQEETANLQDLLIYTLKGLALCHERLRAAGGAPPDQPTALFVSHALFSTITNVVFDPDRVRELIRHGLRLKAELLQRDPALFAGEDHPAALWFPGDADALRQKAYQVGILFGDPDEDVRSLRETITYGLKGLAAYHHHALLLGYDDPEITRFTLRALAATLRPLALAELLDLALETGTFTIRSMALLERANTSAYGNPEITRVPLGVRGNPGILITGHDLKDLDELLEQTDGTGVDVYTHSEMLPAHYYPAFHKHAHLAGNYGNAWWNQELDFAAFNGPILVTSNCIVPVADAYRGRIFTTGPAAYPGVPHIQPDSATGRKDFSALIALAKACPPPTPLEDGTFVGGFGRHQLELLSGDIVRLVRSGQIKQFLVMGGCDGRDPAREYYRDLTAKLSSDTVILTAGCAKFRFMHVPVGDIQGVPRILDAGQCNDCYALVSIALTLQKVFGTVDINDLPIAYDIPWYDQKSVAVLLALLSLGVRRIRLGPTLPAFLSPAVRRILTDRFDLRPITTAAEDLAAIQGGY